MKLKLRLKKELFSILLLLLTLNLSGQTEEPCPTIIESKSVKLTISPVKSTFLCVDHLIDISEFGFKNQDEVKDAFQSFFKDDHFEMTIISAQKLVMHLNVRSYGDLDYYGWKSYIESLKIKE